MRTVLIATAALIAGLAYRREGAVFTIEVTSLEDELNAANYQVMRQGRIIDRLMDELTTKGADVDAIFELICEEMDNEIPF